MKPAHQESEEEKSNIDIENGSNIEGQSKRVDGEKRRAIKELISQIRGGRAALAKLEPAIQTYITHIGNAELPRETRENLKRVADDLLSEARNQAIGLEQLKNYMDTMISESCSVFLKGRDPAYEEREIFKGCRPIFMISMVVVTIIMSPLYLCVVTVKCIDEVGNWILLLIGISVLVLGILSSSIKTLDIALAGVYMGIIQGIVIAIQKALHKAIPEKESENADYRELREKINSTAYDSIHSPETLTAHIFSWFHKWKTEVDKDNYIAIKTRLRTLTPNQLEELTTFKNFIFGSLTEIDSAITIIESISGTLGLIIPAEIYVELKTIRSSYWSFLKDHSTIDTELLLRWQADKSNPPLDGMYVLLTHPGFWSLLFLLEYPEEKLEFKQMLKSSSRVELMEMFSNISRGFDFSKVKMIQTPQIII